MRALQYVTVGHEPVVVDIPTPTPAPGQVLLKVLAAGICHSDQFIMSLPAEQYIYGTPLTLGHEGVGEVVEVGDGVSPALLGQNVAVYGPWGCGYCRACVVGQESYCVNAAALGIAPPGLGAPGAMAEFQIVNDTRFLFPIGDLDPVKAVSLTDAGLTPYHAIKNELAKLTPGSTAVTIGVGGLGHVGIQILKAISGARVIALDVSDEKLALAAKVGADETVISDAEAAARIRDLTGGYGADVVFDFVGATPTLETARQAVAVNGSIVIVGIGGGVVPTGFFSTPFGVQVRAPYWGSRGELAEVIALAQAGLIDVEVEKFSLDQGPEAYRLLHDGKITGRAVLVP